MRVIGKSVLFVSFLMVWSQFCQAEPSTTAPATEKRPPNIVLIFADDLGWKDVGFNKTDFYETPNIDLLASEGMVFNQAYAAGANCAPSRACLISGQYTPRHEVYAVDTTKRGPQEQMRLEPIPNKSGVASGEVTIADALKSAGYTTGIFGKWHLGGKDGAAPTEQGFDVATHLAPPGGKTEDDEETTGARRKRAARAAPQTDDPKGIFSITQDACEFLEANRNRPFFAYVAHHAVHTPIQARPQTVQRFKAKTPGKQHRDPLYAACTFDLDEGVGILLKKLDDLGLRENTLVVFTSDNGGTPQSSQEPLRGNKGAYYEGGIREPFIVRWPGVTEPGAQCEVPVINVDLFPTFVEAAGGTMPANKILDGESLVALLRGGTKLNRTSIFWHFPGYLDRPVTRGRDPLFRTRPVSVIRKGDWKLFLYHEEWLLDGGKEKLGTNKAVELYNLRTDPGEHVDLATSDTAHRDELLADLLEWMDKAGAKFAKRK